jgi:hypothetical protein
MGVDTEEGLGIGSERVIGLGVVGFCYNGGL